MAFFWDNFMFQFFALVEHIGEYFRKDRQQAYTAYFQEGKK